MNPLSQLIEAKTISEVNSIEKKYMAILSDNQKPKFEIVVRKAKQRINNN